MITGHDPKYSLADLIPLETRIGQDRLPLRDQKDRLVIGHNVSYDRSRIKEQYFYDGTKMRFIDTMSLHIAISGLTSYQRTLLKTAKSGGLTVEEIVAAQNVKNGFKGCKSEEILEWQNVSSFNGLNDVYKLYCGGLPLENEKRNIFVTGSLNDIKEDFQSLTTYCARDTMATYRVLCALVPEYFNRFPHPVTFAGMLHMGMPFLPVNRNWSRYIRNSEDAYRDLESELNQILKRDADNACHFMDGDAYKNDPWLWNLDWSVQALKTKKATTKPAARKKSTEAAQRVVDDDQKNEEAEQDPKYDKALEEKFRPLMATKDHLYKVRPFLPGYPAWYRSLCNRDHAELSGPSAISTSTQAVPKLLKLTWDGYPVHHSRELGWGYLVAGRPLEYCKTSTDQNCPNQTFPLAKCLEMFPPRSSGESGGLTKGIISEEEAMKKLHQMTAETADPFGLASMWQVHVLNISISFNKLFFVFIKC
jgi:DNA polymerase gamma 1